jgi:hypothetical protein
MTLNLDLVRGLAEAIDTLYASARSELFRPLDQYPRGGRAEDGIDNAEFGTGAGKITYITEPVSKDDLTAWAAANPERSVYLQRINDTLQGVVCDAEDEIDDLRAIVTRTRGTSKSGVVRERFFLRVEIDWADDTLVREYAL